MSDKFDVRDARDENWLWMRRELIREHGEELGAYGVAVYAALASYADKKQKAFPSYSSIAELLGCSRRKVISCIKQLRELGWVGIENRHSNGEPTSNQYYLLPCPIEGSEYNSPPSEQSAPPSECDAHEEETRKVENNEGGERARVEPEPVQMYHDVFPRRATQFQQDLIKNTVDNLDLWRNVLEYWRGNGHRARSVKKMLNKYEEDKGETGDAGSYDTETWTGTIND